MNQNHSSNKSQGFAHIGLIIVVLVVVAAVAFGGWYVWQSNKDNNQSITSQNSQDQNEQKSDLSGGGKYLVIEEWGVRIPLSEDISGAYYNLNSDDLAEYVGLYDAGFDEMENANGVSCGEDNRYQFYSISRTRPENVDALSEGAGPQYQEFPFTDEYVFGGLGAHQAPPYCANLNPDPYGAFQDDVTIMDIANQKEQEFDKAFKELEADRQ